MKNLAAKVFRECLTSGADLAAHMNALFNATPSAVAKEMQAGALSEMLRIYAKVRDVGYPTKFDDVDVNTFANATPAAMAATLSLKLNPIDSAWLSKNITAMLSVINENREKISFPTPEPAPAPKPLQMQIVGMPERVIESSVSYDKDGNIKSTKQTEKDAA